MTTLDLPVGLRDGPVFAPDGIGAAAERLREAFGPSAADVAERWGRDPDVGDIRWLAVAARIRKDA